MAPKFLKKAKEVAKNAKNAKNVVKDKMGKVKDKVQKVRDQINKWETNTGECIVTKEYRQILAKFSYILLVCLLFLAIGEIFLAIVVYIKVAQLSQLLTSSTITRIISYIVSTFVVLTIFDSFFLYVIDGYQTAEEERDVTSIKRSHVLIKVSYYASYPLAVILMILMIWCSQHFKSIRQELHESMGQHMKVYSTDLVSNEVINQIQWTYYCCGQSNYGNWFDDSLLPINGNDANWLRRRYSWSNLTITDRKRLPFTCCKHDLIHSCRFNDAKPNTNDFQRNGCTESVFQELSGLKRGIQSYFLMQFLIVFTNMILLDIIQQSLQSQYDTRLDPPTVRFPTFNAISFVKRVIKRTPLRTSFVQNSLPSSGSTSQSASIYNAIACKPIAVEEYNRLLIKNQRLAKENALLKTEFSRCKEVLRSKSNENIDLKQEVINSRNESEKLRHELKIKSSLNVTQICDRIKYANSLLIDEYFRVNEIKEQMNEFGNKVETIRGIMTSLESMVDPNNAALEGTEHEISGERMDSLRTLNDSLNRRESRRFSLTPLEQDIRRRLSSDKIKHDFQVMTELSTILELSRENRISSIGFIEDLNSGDITVGQNNGIESIACVVGVDGQPVRVPSLASTSSAQPMTSSRLEKAVKPKKTSKPKETTQKKVTKQKTVNKKKQTVDKKQMKPKNDENVTENKADYSVYDFTDDDDKENVIPPVTRKSKRIRSAAIRARI
ncbi:unnamed protein product [Medioppia subpectinata]|uniref:Uncharacterized protein n=1 Tax=Medioppia subpectinata TaxID=1979941 RepID=A0A7R9Q4G3_9ACAR|nr:unnamed protein product [Medioppia subpectinata]CAG2112265.1 unnamed protein product [Medioppia subpectinata]